MRLLRSLISLVLFTEATLLAGRASADPSKLIPEVGYNYGEIETARSAAMGGALRAFGNGITALYTNPAGMALTRVYHLGALASIWPEPKRQSYGAGAVDSVTGRLAGGIGGSYSSLDPDGVERKWTDVRLALAMPLSDKFFAGLTGKYLKLRQNGVGPLSLRSDLASGGLVEDAIVNNFTFDAGLTVKPTDSLAIGLVGSNLTNPGTGFQPLSLGGGVGYGTRDLTVEGDVLADFTTYLRGNGSAKTTWRTMLGLEYLAADHYPLRLGYRYDQGPATHAISAGLGYLDPQFAVELAVRRSVAGRDVTYPSTSVVIELQYFLESTGITKSPVEPE
jgi:opacity protein-like surface antigen